MTKALREISFYLVAALVIVGSIYFVRLNHQDFVRAMVQQAESYLLVSAKAQAESIEKYIGDILHELEVLSASVILQKSISEIPNIKPGIEAEYYYLLQDAYSDVEKLVDAIYLIDAKGTVLSVSPLKPDITGQDFSRMPDVATALAEHQPYTSGVFENVSGEKVISNICPVFVENKFSGITRAIILVDRVNNLISHINEEGSRRVFIIDSRGSIIGYPDKYYIGKNISDIINDRFFGYTPEELNTLSDGMRGGKQAQIAVGNTLAAYCPIHIGSGRWSIAVVMQRDVISVPINKNLRDNIIFMVFMFAVFVAVGAIFYKTQKKKNELLVAAATLDIINKQLHLEIKQRKDIQNELQQYLHGKKELPPEG